MLPSTNCKFQHPISIQKLGQKEQGQVRCITLLPVLAKSHFFPLEVASASPESICSITAWVDSPAVHMPTLT